VTQAVPDVGVALEEEEQDEDEHPELEVIVGHEELSIAGFRFNCRTQRKRV
jgi:hypothetical protein